MAKNSDALSKSAINHAVLHHAKQEYHTGCPKVYMKDVLAGSPEPIGKDTDPEDVYRCCNELAEVGMLLAIDITVVRSANGDECLALGPSPAISITEKGLCYIEFLFSPND